LYYERTLPLCIGRVGSAIRPCELVDSETRNAQLKSEP